MATIGIDVTGLSHSSSGGIGTSQYRTMGALAELDSRHRFVMYAATPPVIPFTDSPLDLPWELRVGTGPTTRSNIVWMQTGANRLLAEDHVDVFWSPRHLLPFRAKQLATVASVQDFWHLYHPEQQPLQNRLANTFLIDRIIKSADRVVTTSEATAVDAVRFYDIDRARIDVVPLGVDTAQFAPAPADEIAKLLASSGIDQPYVLSLDIFNPRKNFSAVIDAVAALPAETRARFVVVGVGRQRATAKGFDPLAHAIARGLRGRVHVLEDVPAEKLRVLYSGATALVYPSTYEGFGMPILEAMACGCPVITAKSSSLPEVAGDAGILVDPSDTAALGGAIAGLIVESAERGRLVAAGKERVAKFTWQRTAEGMLASFERALAEHKRGAS
jgi:glycosyltransferase involved in cell wall biosynthesis